MVSGTGVEIRGGSFSQDSTIPPKTPIVLTTPNTHKGRRRRRGAGTRIWDAETEEGGALASAAGSRKLTVRGTIIVASPLLTTPGEGRVCEVLRVVASSSSTSAVFSSPVVGKGTLAVCWRRPEINDCCTS